MTASLSIIVPVLNEAAGIVATLDALNRQRASAGAAFPGGIELIVVDGGSSDDTIARCDSRIDRLVRSPPGRGVQLNAGAACAGGDVLWFVHADTRLPEGAIARLAGQLAQHPSARWGRFDVRIEGRSPMLAVVARLMNLRSAWTGIATGDQAMFIRRDSFQQVAGFPDQPLMEDIELSKRLLQLAHGRPLRLRERLGHFWPALGVARRLAHDLADVAAALALLARRLRPTNWRGPTGERRRHHHDPDRRLRQGTAGRICQDAADPAPRGRRLGTSGRAAARARRCRSRCGGTRPGRSVGRTRSRASGLCHAWRRGSSAAARAKATSVAGWRAHSKPDSRPPMRCRCC